MKICWKCVEALTTRRKPPISCNQTKTNRWFNVKYKLQRIFNISTSSHFSPFGMLERMRDTQRVKGGLCKPKIHIRFANTEKNRCLQTYWKSLSAKPRRKEYMRVQISTPLKTTKKNTKSQEAKRSINKKNWLKKNTNFRDERQSSDKATAAQAPNAEQNFYIPSVESEERETQRKHTSFKQILKMRYRTRERTNRSRKKIK